MFQVDTVTNGANPSSLDTLKAARAPAALKDAQTEPSGFPKEREAWSTARETEPIFATCRGNCFVGTLDQGGPQVKDVFLCKEDGFHRAFQPRRIKHVDNSVPHGILAQTRNYHTEIFLSVERAEGAPAASITQLSSPPVEVFAALEVPRKLSEARRHVAKNFLP